VLDSEEPINLNLFRVVFYPHRETVENESINVPVNERQKWFLKQTATGIRISGSDLAAHWNVSQKTAKRDIADLKQKGLIEFLGAPKNGYYRLRS
jgi:predicted HTH transcriptional regulator